MLSKIKERLKDPDTRMRLAIEAVSTAVALSITLLAAALTEEPGWWVLYLVVYYEAKRQGGKVNG